MKAPRREQQRPTGDEMNGRESPAPDNTRASRQRNLEDELEQALVALEDAQAEVTSLIRERDLLAQQLAAAEARLAEERANGAGREAAVEEMRRGFEAAMAHAAAEGISSTATQEELRVALEELRATTEELSESNAALGRLNHRLEDQVAARTAELEEANAALQAEKEHLRLIFEGATDTAIISLDTQGRVSAWNTGAERMVGFTEAEMMGQPLTGMWTREDVEAGVPEQEMRQALEQGRAEDERWHLRKDGSRFWASGVMVPLPPSKDGQSRGFLKIMRDRTDARREEERRTTLLRELDHRVKNTLAVVHAVALQSRRYAPTADSFLEALVARLMALSGSHDLLTRGTWEGASLRDIAEQTLAPYRSEGQGNRITVDGPFLCLTPTAAVTVNLAFHELATNAAKYGALSTPQGRVTVAWRIDCSPSTRPVVEISWRERGGPAVRPPTIRGFGSRLIEHGLQREFAAEVRLDFAPEGVECLMRLPFAARIVVQ